MNIAVNTHNRQAYHLTEQEVGFFDEHGYVVLRNRLPAELLQRLSDATSQVIEQGSGLAPVMSTGMTTGSRTGTQVRRCFE